MLTRTRVEKAVGFVAVGLVAEEVDLQAFQSYTAPDCVFEIMAGQPASGEWHGVDAMKRHFDAFKENLNAEFRFNLTGIIVDAERQMAAARLTVRVATAKMKALR